MAVAAHGGTGWDCHVEGLRFLGREVQAASGRPVTVAVPLPRSAAEPADCLYIAGQGRVALDDDTIAEVRRVLDGGGTVIGEGCLCGPSGEGSAREFAISFFELAQRLGRRLVQVERGHPLLVSRFVFGVPPAGVEESARIMEAEGMVLSFADYGCAWAGGPPDRALPRAAIRDALEFGVNMALYRRDRLGGIGLP
jgi:hypothetical protein